MGDPITTSLPIEPRRRETSEEHQARMDKKRVEAHRFEDLDRAAAAARAVKPTARDTRARAIEAYQYGEGIKAVAARFKVGPATLQAWLEEDGVRLRDAASAARATRRSADPVLEPAAPAPAPAPAPAARPVPRPPQTRTPSRDEQARLAAVTAYVAGDSIATIAGRLGQNESKIRRWLLAADVRMRPSGVPAVEFDVDAVIEQYTAGVTLAALAAEHGVAQSTIRRRLHERGVEMRPGGKRPAVATPDPSPGLHPAAPSAPAPLSTPSPTAPDEQPPAPLEAPAAAVAPTAVQGRSVGVYERAQIVAAYAGGETAVAIAERHGRMPKTIREALRRAGVELRDDRATHSGGQTKTDDPVIVAAVRRLYLDEGLTQAEVAARLGTSPKAVQGVMSRNAIPARPDVTGRTAPVREPAPTRSARLLGERTPATLPDLDDTLRAVDAGVSNVLAAIDDLSDRWADLQIRRDLDAAGAFARLRTAAEQVRALTTPTQLERTAS